MCCAFSFVMWGCGGAGDGHRAFVLMFLAQCMYRTCGSSLLVATSSFWDMAFPRVSGLALQLLGQLLEAGSTEHTCALILLRTMICLGRLVVVLFPAVRCEPENGIFFGPVFWPRFWSSKGEAQLSGLTLVGQKLRPESGLCFGDRRWEAAF